MSPPNINVTPGLLTVVEQDLNRCIELQLAGYEWIAFQTQNDYQLHDYDLSPAAAAGLYAGCWGVSYRPVDFWRDGKNLAEQTLSLGGRFLVMDIEEAAKDTRDARGLRRVIDGCRAGGWAGAVHLNTLGPPYNPDVNDYAIDLQSFLETGGGVQTQCYANAYDSYAPELGVRYWTRVGVPRDRLNIQISLFPAESDAQHPNRRLDGAAWLPLLKAAGVTRDFSIFMAEAATDADITGLLPLSRLPVVVNPTGANRLAALDLLRGSVDYWRVNNLDEWAIQRQRQTLAWRVLNVIQSGANLDAIRAALDKAGAPKP